MSPCRYVTWSVSISPCGYRHRVYYETHGDFHVDMDSHMEISMVDTGCLHAGRECLHVSMCVSMSPCGYRHGVPPCFHVDTTLSLRWIWLHVCRHHNNLNHIITHMDLAPCSHIITHMDLVFSYISLIKTLW